VTGDRKTHKVVCLEAWYRGWPARGVLVRGRNQQDVCQRVCQQVRCISRRAEAGWCEEVVIEKIVDSCAVIYSRRKAVHEEVDALERCASGQHGNLPSPLVNKVTLVVRASEEKL